MSEYIELSSLGVSREAQLRASKLLNVVLETGGKEIFEFGYNKLKYRWEKLSNTLALYNVLNHSYSKVGRGYVWLKCEREEDKDCYAVPQDEANVYGTRGSLFGADDRHVRLTLLRS
ncbi:hypothetical protein PRUPE_8G041400 [Prunus persica]|uniref:Alliinase C-terminal domain-containing protein n=1 Tax=Prunus persica TaxID=3760 RepID=A0A251MVC7_PRUPE|nr:hypothetical protein PRUPE_8G041400 [Prunus persica]